MSGDSQPTVTRAVGALLVLATGVVFSFGALAFRSTDEIEAWPYLMLRGYGAAAVMFIALAAQHRRRAFVVVRETQPVHIAAGVILASMMSSFIIALTHTDTAFILFLQAAAPISSGVFAWLLLKERMSRDAMLATGGALAGIMVMVTGGLDAGIGWPVLIVIYLPIAFGLYSTLIRSGPKIEPLVPALVAGLTAGTMGLLVAVATDGFAMTGKDLAIGLFAGVVLVGLPLPIFHLGQRAVPAPDAALLLMSEIVLAPVWVWIAFDEKPTAVTLVGGAVMLVSVTWLTLRTVGATKPAADRRPVRSSRG